MVNKSVYTFLVTLICVANCAHSSNPNFLSILKNSTCSNLDDVMNKFQWNDRNVNPYQTNPNGVDIARDQQCYAIIENPEADFDSGTSMKYSLYDMTADQAAQSNKTTEGHTYLTHNYTCGACSTLEDLNVFLVQKDLTTPVKSCILQSLWKIWLTAEQQRAAISECFQETLGFTDMCSVIWQYNSQNTKEHCEVNCLLQEQILHLPNNVPQQRSGGFMDSNFCAPDICPQKINGKNACEAFQWQNGPYRLNSCIQCDECNSGPVFQKFSGRTRRNTGIISAIARPIEQRSFVDHYYGI